MGADMKAGKGPYLAYLLRLWRVSQGGASTWMASLESTATGERHGFADLEAMLAFLNQTIEQDERPVENPEQPGKEVASRSKYNPGDD